MVHFFWLAEKRCFMLISLMHGIINQMSSLICLAYCETPRGFGWPSMTDYLFFIGQCNLWTYNILVWNRLNEQWLQSLLKDMSPHFQIKWPVNIRFACMMSWYLQINNCSNKTLPGLYGKDCQWFLFLWFRMLYQNFLWYLTISWDLLDGVSQMET